MQNPLSAVLQRPPQRLRARAAVLLLGAIVSLLVIADSASAANFTWSGGGTSTAWSEGANWVGGVAPSAGASLGTVTFPEVGGPHSSTNDLSGISVNELQLAGSGYDLSGQGLTLGSGGLSIAGSELVGFKVSNPIALSGSQTWTASSRAEVAGQLSGTSSAVTLNDSSYTSFTFGEALGSTPVDDEIGDVTINGVEKTESDGATFKTPVELQAKLNASDGHSVSVSHVYLTSEAAVGPLSATSSWATLAGSAGALSLHDSVLDPAEILSVPSASLDSASEFNDTLSHEGSMPGSDYGQLKASGPVSLGGASLVLEDQYPKVSRECGPPIVGQVDTLISASSISGQFAEVPNGGTVVSGCVAFGGPHGVSERAYAWRINYNTATTPQTVTATALAGVPEPTPSPTPSPAPTGGGTPITTTAPGTTTTPAATISSAQLVASLRPQLLPSGGAVKIGSLLKHGGLSISFKALEAGTLTIDWWQVPKGAKLARKAKPVLVASGKAVFTGTGTRLVKVRLTAAGRKLLAHAKKQVLKVQGVLAPTGQAPVSLVRAITLRR